MTSEKLFLSKKQSFSLQANLDLLNFNTFDAYPKPDLDFNTVDLKTKPYLVGSKIRKINLHVGSFVKIDSSGILLIRLQMIPNEIDIASYAETKKQEMLFLEEALGFGGNDSDPYYNPHIPSESVKYTNTHIIDFVG